jgi:hypothetical protein
VVYTQTQIKESRGEGRRLTEGLSRGWRPEPIRVPIQLQPGEHCYAHGNAQVWQFLEGDSSYVHKSRLGFGLVGMAMVAGTAVGNTARKSRAAKEAAPRFRPVEQGPFYLTDRRFAIQGQTQWVDLWFSEIRMASCDSVGITLHISGLPPTQLQMWPIDYFFALYHFLANGEIIEIPPDPV